MKRQSSTSIFSKETHCQHLSSIPQAKYCSKPWWSIIAVFQSQHPHIPLLFKTTVYWINICSSFTSSPCLEAMLNYWLAKMKLLRQSSCGSWQGSQQVRTPTFKQGQRHGSHVDTAKMWHSRAAFISGYPVMLFTHCFSNKFYSLPNKITQYSKRSKRFKLRCWEKKISIKRRSLKDDFFLAVLGNN